LREIERMIESMSPSTRARLSALTTRECEQAAQCEFPHLYATPPEQRYSPWGSGTEVGFSRVKSDNLQVRLRGIALWLAVVYHETRDSAYAEPEALHRRVLGILRMLKDSVGAGHAGSEDREVA
jgi:hypothetical protein